MNVRQDVARLGDQPPSNVRARHRKIGAEQLKFGRGSPPFQGIAIGREFPQALNIEDAA